MPRVGDRTFQQAAGFLRIMDGDNPLDASAVHPEAYPVVERIVAKTGLDVKELIGKTAVLRALKPEDFADAQFGVPTVKDILSELEKPGRDPRPEFKTAAFKEGVNEIADLQPGMTLEGVVTNVANFGAFVDIGVHQDGLVHVSQLADRFVKDPRDVVKAGDIVSVRVVDVDLKRKRIALTMKKHDVQMQGQGERSGERSGVAGPRDEGRETRDAQAAPPRARRPGPPAAADRRPGRWRRPSPSCAATSSLPLRRFTPAPCRRARAAGPHVCLIEW